MYAIRSYYEIHRTEPYVYSQTIAGRSAKNYGEAKNSWLTGTAAWTFTAASQGILGIIPEYDGLKVTPCLPASIKKYHATRLFRNATYDITVVNNGDKEIAVSLDGVKCENNIIPFIEGKNHYNVINSH